MNSWSQWSYIEEAIFAIYREDPATSYSKAARQLLEDNTITYKPEHSISKGNINTLRTYIKRILQKADVEEFSTDNISSTENYDRPVDQKALQRFCEEKGIDFSKVQSAKYISHIPGFETFNVVLKEANDAIAVDWEAKFEELIPYFDSLSSGPKRKPVSTYDKALVLFFSDEHVGLRIMDNNMYGVQYNENIFRSRMKEAAELVHILMATHNFDKIVICQLGDELDGYNGTTTRQTHPLPQNLTNEEQYDVWVKAKSEFVTEIATSYLDVDIEIMCMANSNHSGLGFSYMAFNTLREYLLRVFPDISTTISRSFIQPMEVMEHQYLLTHGKDDQFMKRGWPLHLDDKISGKLKEYIAHFGVSGKSIRLVKGDLHTAAADLTSKFSYRGVLSLAGDSDYSMMNFEKSVPGLSYDVILDRNNIVMGGDYPFNS